MSARFLSVNVRLVAFLFSLLAIITILVRNLWRTPYQFKTELLPIDNYCHLLNLSSQSSELATSFRIDCESYPLDFTRPPFSPNPLCPNVFVYPGSHNGIGHQLSVLAVALSVAYRIHSAVVLRNLAAAWYTHNR